MTAPRTCRVMRARKHSLCGYCAGPVTVGQHIARVGRPAVWVHLNPCALRLAGQPAPPRKAPRP